jgi:hypothetical protein
MRTSLRWCPALLLLLSACAAPAPAPPKAAPASPKPTLYERVADKLAKRPDLEKLGQPPAELEQVSWMLGEWTVEAKVYATPANPESVEQGRCSITKVLGDSWLQLADTYPEGTQDLGFLTYNLVTRRWVSLGLDSLGNSIATHGERWVSDRLVLTAPGVEIMGEVVTLRQTIVRTGQDEFRLVNEEQRPDGSWVALDEYRYRREGKKAE